MNTRDLLAALREMLDDSIKPYQWSDASLIRKLNNAVREACLRARLLKDDEASCPSLCRVPVTAGQARIKYPKEVLVVRNGRLAAGPCNLWALTADSLDKWRGNWDVDDQQQGAPEIMVMDLAQKTIRLYPTPSADDTLYLRAWRVARPSELLTLAALEREPVIQIPDPEELCHWAAHEAYMTRDEETMDTKAASDHLALFEARFGKRPTLHDMARWADSPPRVRYGHFF